MANLAFPRIVYHYTLGKFELEYGYRWTRCNSSDEWETMKAKGYVLHPSQLKELPEKFAGEDLDAELDQADDSPEAPAAKKAGRTKKAA